MAIRNCPRCNRRYMVDPQVNEFSHECNSGTNALDNEDVVVSGDWDDYTGSATIGHAVVMKQGAGNKIQGTTGWIKGARPKTVTKRGANVDTHRTRQHLEWINDGRKSKKEQR